MAEKLGRVLIVDDEKDNLSALTRLLRKDFDVESCEGSLEALKTLDKDPNFDVILSDQRMPDMTGSELFERIQNINPSATRILISGFSDLEAVIDAVNRGHIWKYVSKPWEPSELKETLRDAVERSQMKIEIDRSHQELRRAALELRAKDWSRERLLSLLLHEFRSIPQILENILALNLDVEHAEDRSKFLSGLNNRIGALRGDVESLLEDEKALSQLPREALDLKSLLEELLIDKRIGSSGKPEDFHVVSCKSVLSEGLSHLFELLSNNSTKSPIETNLDAGPKNKKIFLSAKCEASESIFPEGLKDSNIEAPLAWRALLEPFVGSQHILHHQSGLRVDSARHIRRLSALGVKSEFQVSEDSKKVELLISIDK